MENLKAQLFGMAYGEWALRYLHLYSTSSSAYRKTFARRHKTCKHTHTQSQGPTARVTAAMFLWKPTTFWVAAAQQQRYRVKEKETLAVNRRGTHDLFTYAVCVHTFGL